MLHSSNCNDNLIEQGLVKKDLLEILVLTFLVDRFLFHSLLVPFS
jgi:hypothetical protein